MDESTISAKGRLGPGMNDLRGPRDRGGELPVLFFSVPGLSMEVMVCPLRTITYSHTC